MKLLLCDVGDGLNLFIQNGVTNNSLMVDFGGNRNLYFRDGRIDSFLLSHFHRDHYNGVLGCPPYSLRHLNFFYHPIMPKFIDSQKFYRCLFAMNSRLSLGTPLQNSILSIVNRISRRHVKYLPLGKGDKFICGGKEYEILWPPKELKEADTLKSINNAINDFEEARKEDYILDAIYNSISDEILQNNLAEILESEYTAIQNSNEINEEISQVIKSANKSLRSAANRLSIAFKQNDQILFLGDLESNEINQVVSQLEKQKYTYFEIIISAHHGTHWHDKLNSINSNFCLVSNGKKMRKFIKNQYINICKKFITTDHWGDIKIKTKYKIY